MPGSNHHRSGPWDLASMSDTLKGTAWRRPWPPGDVVLSYNKENSEDTVEHKKNRWKLHWR